ncbi:hypothetical protein DYY66_0127 [Candidatus Nitrosotalea sp. FS]|nr:hypothetical protein [Candidatus Nitrosotalea sp. FS]
MLPFSPTFIAAWISGCKRIEFNIIWYFFFTFGTCSYHNKATKM